MRRVRRVAFSVNQTRVRLQRQQTTAFTTPVDKPVHVYLETTGIGVVLAFSFGRKIGDRIFIWGVPHTHKILFLSPVKYHWLYLSVVIITVKCKFLLIV